MNRNFRLAKFVLLLGVGLLAAVFAVLAPVSAQETTGSINGFVTDPSGAAVSGATVTASDVNRGTAYPTQTNSDGAYYLTHLPVGSYTVKVEARGFQIAVHSAFDLVLDQVARIDVKLTVGTMSQTVEVTGAPPCCKQKQQTSAPTSITW